MGCGPDQHTRFLAHTGRGSRDQAHKEAKPEEVPGLQAWLEQLALLLPPPEAPGATPSKIKLSKLRQQLPVPKSIVLHYGGAAAFFKARPELHMAKGGGNAGKTSISLVPKHHWRLLKSTRANGTGF